MRTVDFYNKLEAELAPLTDAQVDAVSSAAESNWRYRIEVWCILAVSAMTPLAAAILAIFATREFATGLARLLAGVCMVVCIYGSVRLVKALASPVVTWRFRASFVRQLRVDKRPAQGGTPRSG